MFAHILFAAFPARPILALKVEPGWRVRLTNLDPRHDFVAVLRSPSVWRTEALTLAGHAIANGSDMDWLHPGENDWVTLRLHQSALFFVEGPFVGVQGPSPTTRVRYLGDHHPVPPHIARGRAWVPKGLLYYVPTRPRP